MITDEGRCKLQFLKRVAFDTGADSYVAMKRVTHITDPNGWLQTNQLIKERELYLISR